MFLTRTCCLCGENFEGFGNNPEPLRENKEENRCCNECNDNLVVPARLYNASKGKDMREIMTQEEIDKMFKTTVEEK